MRASEAEFERYVQSHLEPLAKGRGAVVSRKADPQLQAAEFTAEQLRVCLENDRGLLSLTLSPTHTNRAWSVDTVSNLFPRIRSEAGGTQRLTLDEQFQFVRERWAELQSRFRLSDYKATVRFMEAASR